MAKNPDKKWRNVPPKRKAAIAWEKLRTEEYKIKFKEETAKAIEDDEIGKTREWEEIAEILTSSARRVCGTKPKTIQNPWTIGHEGTLEELQLEINKWVRAETKYFWTRKHRGSGSTLSKRN